MKNTLPTRDDETRLEPLLLALPAFRNAVHGASASSLLFGQLAALAMTTVALLLRFWLDPFLPPGFPYLTFFPAVFITGFVWGIYPAITSAVLSGLVAWYWFISPSGSFALDAQGATALAFYVFIVTTNIALLGLALNALGAQARSRQALTKALQLQEVISEEVDHRLKNIMATLSGLISLLQKHVSTPAQLGERLRHKITALSRSIDLLRGAAHGEEITFRAAIHAVLDPLGVTDQKRLTLDGPDLVISANGIIPLNLILHELGTNSLKHGAFSDQSGVVSIDWSMVPSEDEHAMLHLTWVERAGPATAPPQHSGFGTELLNRMSQSMGGECKLAYDPEGLTARITLDCANMLEGH
jgi:two-component sensor histidine kinase